MKKTIIVLAVVLVLTLGTVAFAAEVLTPEQQEFFDSKAERVEELVEDGRITREQADDFLADFEQKLVDGTCDGTGENCENGEGCGLGLNADGECQGLGLGQGNGKGLGCGGNGSGRCGRNR